MRPKIGVLCGSHITESGEKLEGLTVCAEIKWRLLIAVSPAWAWLLAITVLPHKEERFLYVVYPLVSHLLKTALAEHYP